MGIRERIAQEIVETELFHTYRMHNGEKIPTYIAEGYDKEKIESEAEEAPFELETSGEEIELEAEEESLEKEEIMEIETPEAQIKPEVIEEPGRSKPSVTKIVEAPEKPSGEIKGIEIVSWGMPQKISPASLKLPLVLKLNEIKKEAKINIIIKLEEPIVE